MIETINQRNYVSKLTVRYGVAIIPAARLPWINPRPNPAKRGSETRPTASAVLWIADFQKLA